MSEGYWFEMGRIFARLTPLLVIVALALLVVGVAALWDALASKFKGRA